MTVALVWAQAANGVIGDRGTLPWHLPEDLARFRELTTGATVVMGRATWDSLPTRFRPLPGRDNVVLTRDGSWSADGARAAGSLDAALAGAGGVEGVEGVEGTVWVIGGASVYAAALPLADRVEVTELRDAFDGDVQAPVLDGGWRVTAREPAEGWHTSRTGLQFRTVSYRRSARSPTAAPHRSHIDAPHRSHIDAPHRSHIDAPHRSPTAAQRRFPSSV